MIDHRPKRHPQPCRPPFPGQAFLKRIIAFLSEAADELEKGNGCMKETGDHLHLRDEDKEWENDFPDVDVVVLYPI